MYTRLLLIAALIVLPAVILSGGLISGCTALVAGDKRLMQNTYLELVDWHISGLWFINCPVAWFRVTNNNSVPIEEITMKYRTFDSEGRPLDEGMFTIEGSVEPGTQKHFIEQYIGLVQRDTERLSVQLVSVKQGHSAH